MNKKRKAKKILSRALAILGVVVILVSVFAIPASAWEVTDIHFYNFFDTNAVPSTTRNDGRQAYVTSVDEKSGVINLSAIYTVNDIYYLPYQYSGLTLRDLLPEAIVGETYVLSGEYLSCSFTETDALFMKRVNLVNGNAWDKQKQWLFGDALTLTEDDLNANVTIFFADLGKATARPQSGEVMNVSLRLWVNKDVACEFVPHNLAYDLAKDELDAAFKDGEASGYQDGFDAGYDDGYLDGEEAGKLVYADENLVLNKNNVSFAPLYYDDVTGLVKKGIVTNSDCGYWYPFDGYGLYASKIDDAYKNGNIPNGTKMVGFYISLDTIQSGTYMKLGEVDFGLLASDGMCYKLSVTFADGSAVVVDCTQCSDRLSSDTYLSFGWDGAYYFDFSYVNDFQGYTAESIVTNLSIELVVKNPATQVLYDANFGLVFTNTDSENYKAGFQQGLSEGYVDGKADGYAVGVKDGKEFGYDDGYADGQYFGTMQGYQDGYYYGKQDGEKTGYDKGQEAGYVLGKKDGYDDGYLKGEESGYYKGKADEQKQSTFYSLISAVIDAPISAFQSLLNFEVMGVNVSGFILALITLCLVIAVVKFLF